MTDPACARPCACRLRARASPRPVASLGRAPTFPTTDRRRSGDELGFYFIDLLRQGLEIPKPEIFEGLDAFVEDGMRNEWLDEQHLFPEARHSRRVQVRDDTGGFTLRLTVTNDERIVFDEKIEWLVITSKHGEPLWRRRLCSCAQGAADVTEQ